jgi:hypothetical protein
MWWRCHDSVIKEEDMHMSWFVKSRNADGQPVNTIPCDTPQKVYPSCNEPVTNKNSDSGLAPSPSSNSPMLLGQDRVDNLTGERLPISIADDEPADSASAGTRRRSFKLRQ